MYIIKIQNMYIYIKYIKIHKNNIYIYIFNYIVLIYSLTHKYSYIFIKSILYIYFTYIIWLKFIYYNIYLNIFK